MHVPARRGETESDSPGLDRAQSCLGRQAHAPVVGIDAGHRGESHQEQVEEAQALVEIEIRANGAGHGIDSVTVEPGAYKTEISRRFVDPERKAEAAAYGPLADAGAMWQESLDAYFATGGSNPTEVVDAIVDLIEAKPEERPARVAIGADVGFVNKMNEAALPAQREGVETFGMQDFLPLVR